MLTTLSPIRLIFDEAAKCRPSVIMVKDIDTLLATRIGHSAFPACSELMLRLHSLPLSKGVIVLGTAKEPWRSEHHLGRFHATIAIGLPGHAARVDMVRLFLGAAPHSLNEEQFGSLAAATEGFSGSDIKAAVKSGMLEPVRRVFTATHFKVVSGPDPENPSVIRDDLVTHCTPGEPGAFAAQFKDVSDRFCVHTAPVSFSDLEKAVAQGKPSVSCEYLRKLNTWRSTQDE